MFAKKECIAMLLAGGQGSRLGSLTRKMAKPAIQFGGKYRIIDFPLSNCVNSGIDTVGVLTQYSPFFLNEYIGTGQPWDLDRLYGGVHILPPYESAKGAKWYAGTANAIYQNMSFIDRYNPEYVLILSGDHIYKMNYDTMLKYHKYRKADCTIAVLDVPKKEASRFGIMNCDELGVISEFEEKPKKPKSTLASMGIYIFNWKLLRELLREDELDSRSKNDFGKNIIPKMLEKNLRLVVYNFQGYWKDVGTIDSLWEANMDLLRHGGSFNLYNPKWKIYTRNAIQPPHYVGNGANVRQSVVTEGCQIYGDVNYSVLSPGVVIEKGAIVNNSIIMSSCIVKVGANINYSLIGSNCYIGNNASIGMSEELVCRLNDRKITVVAPNTKLKDGAKISPKIN